MRRFAGFAIVGLAVLCVSRRLVLGQPPLQGQAQGTPPASAPATQKKPLTNQDIVTMVKGGLEESIILLTIDASSTEFDLSPDALIALKKQGVSETVIRAMVAAQAKKNVPLRSGAGAASAASGRRADVDSPVFPVDFFAEQFALSAATGQTAPEGRIFVGQGRLRFEPARRDSSTPATIVDPVRLTGYRIAAGKLVETIPRFEGVRGVINNEGLSKYLLPVDPQNPCAYWLNVECKAMGSESLGGRATTKWEVKHFFANESWTSRVWVDVRLHIVSKHEYENEIVELRNIVEGTQPAGLFEVP